MFPRQIAPAAILLLSFVSGQALRGQTASKTTASAILFGTVRDAGGHPMEGVAVSAAAAGATITTSVYTDD